MFAIVEIAGQQFKIDGSTKTLRVPYMDGAEPGSSVNVDKVLVAQSAEGKVSTNGKATISATVTGHGKADKILVFHKKRRKGYRKTNGHRQPFTEVAINSFAV